MIPVRAKAPLPKPPVARKPEPPRKPHVSVGGGKPGKPPHVDFATIFDLHYSKDQFTEKEERETGVLSPSHGLTMDHACHRQCTFALLQTVPDKPKSRKAAGFELLIKKTSENGEHRHAFIQNRFLRMAEEGFMGIQEVHIEPTLRHPTLRLKGQSDILVKQNGYWFILDIKTRGKNACEKMFGPEESSKLQLNTYMGLSGIRAAYIMTEVRDDLSWVKPASNFRVDFDEEMWKSTLELAKSVTGYAQKRKLPMFDQAICNKHRVYCKFVGACEAELNGKPFEAEGMKSWPLDTHSLIR